MTSPCPCPKCGEHSGRWKNQHIKAEPTLCDKCFDVEEARNKAAYNAERENEAYTILLNNGFTDEQAQALEEWFEIKMEVHNETHR